MEYILEKHLVIHSREADPIFVTRNCKEVLDLTIDTRSKRIFIKNWLVSKEASFSGYNNIYFSIDWKKENHMHRLGNQENELEQI